MQTRLQLPVHDEHDARDARDANHAHDDHPGAGSRARVTCDGCDGRRAFIRDAVGAVAGVIALSLIASPCELQALSSSGSPVRYPIPLVDGVAIDKRNEVMLCRAGDRVFAFALSCPHQNTALRALGGAAGFQCPKHKSRYKTDGTFISGRATRNMDRLPISRDGDAVVVDVDVAYQSDKDAARWAAAVVTL
ncbi:MAG: Rieske 2Fe-2S domain-containing protein [Gemmatimonadota bacterium]